MKKIKILLPAITVCFYSFAQKANLAKNPAIDAYVKKEMREIGAPGIAVAVIKDGKVLHCNTYGLANIEYQLPVTANTTFQIASVSKLFTATLVMKWLQEQKLSLDDYVTKYISDAPASWKPIQLRHLLAHEGGMIWPSTLGGYTGVGNAKNFKVEPLADLIQNLKDSALVFAPGSKQVYQNGDYFVLQYILEKISGKAIEHLFKEVLFVPLGMRSSGYDVEVRSFPFQTMLPVANKSQNFTKGKDGPLIFKGFYSPASYTAGGMFLSIADGIKWAVALDRETFINKEILAQSRLTTASNGGFTQLGWTIQNNEGHEMIGHSGGPGLGDVIRFPKEKLTVIVLNNYADMYPYLTQHIAKFYLKDIKPQPMPKTFNRNLAK